MPRDMQSAKKEKESVAAAKYSAHQNQIVKAFGINIITGPSTLATELRNCRDLQSPRTNLEYIKKGFHCSPVKVWNDIPINIG